MEQQLLLDLKLDLTKAQAELNRFKSQAKGVSLVNETKTIQSIEKVSQKLDSLKQKLVITPTVDTANVTKQLNTVKKKIQDELGSVNITTDIQIDTAALKKSISDAFDTTGSMANINALQRGLDGLQASLTGMAGAIEIDVSSIDAATAKIDALQDKLKGLSTNLDLDVNLSGANNNQNQVFAATPKNSDQVRQVEQDASSTPRTSLSQNYIENVTRDTRKASNQVGRASNESLERYLKELTAHQQNLKNAGHDSGMAQIVNKLDATLSKVARKFDRKGGDSKQVIEDVKVKLDASGFQDVLVNFFPQGGKPNVPRDTNGRIEGRPEIDFVDGEANKILNSFTQTISGFVAELSTLDAATPLVKRNGSFAPGSNGQFRHIDEAVHLSPRVANGIQGAANGQPVTLKDLNTLVHEIRHAQQRATKGLARKDLMLTPQNAQEAVLVSGVRQNYKNRPQGAIDLEIDAHLFAERMSKQIAEMAGLMTFDMSPFENTKSQVDSVMSTLVETLEALEDGTELSENQAKVYKQVVEQSAERLTRLKAGIQSGIPKNFRPGSPQGAKFKEQQRVADSIPTFPANANFRQIQSGTARNQLDGSRFASGSFGQSRGGKTRNDAFDVFDSVEFNEGDLPDIPEALQAEIEAQFSAWNPDGTDFDFEAFEESLAAGVNGALADVLAAIDYEREEGSVNGGEGTRSLSGQTRGRGNRFFDDFTTPVGEAAPRERRRILEEETDQQAAEIINRRQRRNSIGLRPGEGLGSMVEDLSQVDGLLGTVFKTFKGFGQAAGKFPLLTIFGALSGVLGTIVRDAAQTEIAFQKLELTMKALKIDGFDAAIEQVKDLGRDFGISLEQSAAALGKFQAATRGTELEGQAPEIFGAVSQYGATIGVDQEALGRAFVALEQIAAKGRVSLEELNGQLAEALPGASNIAAEALGITRAEMFRMAEAGDLMANDLIPKMAAEMRALGVAAEATSELTLAQEWNRFNANLEIAKTEGVAATGVLDLLTATLGKLNDVVGDSELIMSIMSESVALLTALVAALGVVIVSALLPVIVAGATALGGILVAAAPIVPVIAAITVAFYALIKVVQLWRSDPIANILGDDAGRKKEIEDLKKTGKALDELIDKSIKLNAVNKNKKYFNPELTSLDEEQQSDLRDNLDKGGLSGFKNRLLVDFSLGKAETDTNEYLQHRQFLNSALKEISGDIPVLSDGFYAVTRGLLGLEHGLNKVSGVIAHIIPGQKGSAGDKRGTGKRIEEVNEVARQQEIQAARLRVEQVRAAKAQLDNVDNDAVQKAKDDADIQIAEARRVRRVIADMPNISTNDPIAFNQQYKSQFLNRLKNAQVSESTLEQARGLKGKSEIDEFADALNKVAQKNKTDADSSTDATLQKVFQQQRAALEKAYETAVTPEAKKILGEALGKTEDLDNSLKKNTKVLENSNKVIAELTKATLFRERENVARDQLATQGETNIYRNASLSGIYNDDALSSAKDVNTLQRLNSESGRTRQFEDAAFNQLAIALTRKEHTEARKDLGAATGISFAGDANQIAAALKQLSPADFDKITDDSGDDNLLQSSGLTARFKNLFELQQESIADQTRIENEKAQLIHEIGKKEKERLERELELEEQRGDLADSIQKSRRDFLESERDRVKSNQESAKTHAERMKDFVDSTENANEALMDAGKTLTETFDDMIESLDDEIKGIIAETTKLELAESIAKLNAEQTRALNGIDLSDSASASLEFSDTIRELANNAKEADLDFELQADEIKDNFDDGIDGIESAFDTYLTAFDNFQQALVDIEEQRKEELKQRQEQLEQEAKAHRDAQEARQETIKQESRSIRDLVKSFKEFSLGLVDLSGKTNAFNAQDLAGRAAAGAFGTGVNANTSANYKEFFGTGSSDADLANAIKAGQVAGQNQHNEVANKTNELLEVEKNIEKQSKSNSTSLEDIAYNTSMPQETNVTVSGNSDSDYYLNELLIMSNAIYECLKEGGFGSGGSNVSEADFEHAKLVAGVDQQSKDGLAKLEGLNSLLKTQVEKVNQDGRSVGQIDGAAQGLIDIKNQAMKAVTEHQMNQKAREHVGLERLPQEVQMSDIGDILKTKNGRIIELDGGFMETDERGVGGGFYGHNEAERPMREARFNLINSLGVDSAGGMLTYFGEVIDEAALKALAERKNKTYIPPTGIPNAAPLSNDSTPGNALNAEEKAINNLFPGTYADKPVAELIDTVKAIDLGGSKTSTSTSDYTSPNGFVSKTDAQKEADLAAEKDRVNNLANPVRNKLDERQDVQNNKNQQQRDTQAAQNDAALAGATSSFLKTMNQSKAAHQENIKTLKKQSETTLNADKLQGKINAANYESKEAVTGLKDRLAALKLEVANNELAFTESTKGVTGNNLALLTQARNQERQQENELQTALNRNINQANNQLRGQEATNQEFETIKFKSFQKYGFKNEVLDAKLQREGASGYFANDQRRDAFKAEQEISRGGEIQERIKTIRESFSGLTEEEIRAKAIAQQTELEAIESSNFRSSLDNLTNFTKETGKNLFKDLLSVDYLSGESIGQQLIGIARSVLDRVQDWASTYVTDSLYDLLFNGGKSKGEDVGDQNEHLGNGIDLAELAKEQVKKGDEAADITIEGEKNQVQKIASEREELLSGINQGKYALGATAIGAGIATGSGTAIGGGIGTILGTIAGTFLGSSTLGATAGGALGSALGGLFAHGTDNFSASDALNMPVAEAMRIEKQKSGRDAQLAVLHEGEAVLSTINGDSDAYRKLKATGQWDLLKQNSYAMGADYVGAARAGNYGNFSNTYNNSKSSNTNVVNNFQFMATDNDIVKRTSEEINSRRARLGLN